MEGNRKVVGPSQAIMNEEERGLSLSSERRNKKGLVPVPNPRIDLRTERYWLDFVTDPTGSTMILGKALRVGNAVDPRTASGLPTGWQTRYD
jgi:hypothetical protein